jgi:type IV pilus assembly protein PilW
MLAPMKPRRQRGLSLVELMVGITIGLIITAAGSVTLVGQLREHLRLSLETQLQQDLRAAADLMQRDLRRAGFWATAETGVWAPGMGGSEVAANPYAVTAGCNAGSSPVQVVYAYAKADDSPPQSPGVPGHPQASAPLSHEHFGFRVKDGVLYFLNGCGSGWQPLTDPNTLKIIPPFKVEPVVQAVSLAGYCSKPCADTDACPQQLIRRFDIVLTAQSAFDAKLVRRITLSSRPRNDLIIGACPA